MTPSVSQVSVNETERLLRRFDLLIEDIQNATSLMLRECEASQARLAGRETVKCTKCRVEVDIAKLNQPGRCEDRHCPLKKEAAQ